MVYYAAITNWYKDKFPFSISIFTPMLQKIILWWLFRKLPNSTALPFKFYDTNPYSSSWTSLNEWCNRQWWNLRINVEINYHRNNKIKSSSTDEESKNTLKSSQTNIKLIELFKIKYWKCGDLDVILKLWGRLNWYHPFYMWVNSGFKRLNNV